MRKKPKENMIHQKFVFKNEIRDQYFVKNDIKDLPESYKEDEEFYQILYLYAANLAQEIGAVLEKPSDYDGYDLNKGSFVLLFYIHKDCYKKSMENFKNWAYANDILKFIEYKDDQDEHDPEKDDEYCHCDFCLLEDDAQKLRRGKIMTDFEAMMLAIQFQRNEIYERMANSMLGIDDDDDFDDKQ